MGTTFLSVWKINLKFDFATDASYSYMINDELETDLTFVQVLQAIADKYSTTPFSVTIDGTEYLSVEPAVEPLKDFSDILDILKVGITDGATIGSVISMFFTIGTTMINTTFVPTGANVTVSNVLPGTFKVSESSIQSIANTLNLVPVSLV